MKRGTLLALGLAAAVGGWIALFERGEPDAGNDDAVFGVEVADVDAVLLVRPGEADVRLTRGGDGFTVREGDGEPAPADPAEADELLQNVASLASGRTLAGDAAEFGLDPPALSIAVVVGDETLTAALGDETLTGGNRYLRFGDALMVTPERAFRNFDRSAWDLRDRRVFRGDPSARGLRVEADGARAAMTRDGGDWTVTEPFRLRADPFSAAQLAANLLDLRMTALAQGDGDFGFATPRLAAEITLARGEEVEARTVVFGADRPPGVSARVEGDPLVFVVAEEPVEALEEAARDGLESVRSLRLFGFSVWDVDEARFGETEFARSETAEGTEWTLGGEPVDASAVEDLLYRLNSTDADAVGDEPGDSEPDWVLRVGDEEVTVRVGEDEVLAHRAGDERTLALSRATWDGIVGLLEAASRPAEE